MKTRKLFLALLMLLISAIAVTVIACDNGSSNITEGPETGVYYNYAQDGDNMLTLFGGNKFTLTVNEKSISGKYVIDNENLTLNSDNSEDEAITGDYDGVNITLRYENIPLKFWKNIKYTVTFDPNNEEATQKVTVRNGETLTAPDDPEKAGNAFLGWFKDDDTPFGFDAEPITKDMTLKAKWRTAKVGSNEFTVKFEVGDYEGAKAPEAQTTKGGTIPVLTEPTRDGHNFQGWWVSYYEDASKLAYKLTTETVIKQNMTVYALWTGRNENPMLPEVNSEAISWNSISGVSEYNVEIKNANGDTVFSLTDSQSQCKVNWSQYAAGDYTIKVQNKNGSEMRYYRNKALDRVSLFEVTGNTLKFNKVENATNYYLDIDCGDENHKHDRLDNGPSTTYNFENCPMDESGKISFKVTATAPGYAESVSEVYEYERMLDSLDDKWDVDEENEEVVWEDIPAATGYNVVISCENDAHEHTYNGIDTSISYKECATGKVIIEVTPIAKGYGSPAYTRIEIEKTTLSTPSNIKVIGNEITWDKVKGATSYEINVNNASTPSTVNEEKFNISSILTGIGEKASIRITAISADKKSLPTENVDILYNELDDASFRYVNGMLYWTHVGGASHYEIKINDTNTFNVIGKNHTKINLTKEGENKITLIFVDTDNIKSSEISLTVMANKVILNGEGGTFDGNQSKTLYKAAGDDMTDLPVPQKEGYVFGGWYNTPGGASSNGGRYNDRIFVGGSLNLYANWLSKPYTVRFETSGDEIEGELPDDFIVKFGEDFNLPVISAANKVKSFIGWSPVRNNIGRRVTDDNGKSLHPWNLNEVNEDGNIILYPIFVESLRYDLIGNSYTVSKNSAGIHYVTSVIIPDKINDKEVTAIGDFSNCVNLKTISIPNTVTSLNASTVFSGCISLESIEMREVVRDAKYSSENGALISNEDGKKMMVFMPHGIKGKYEISREVTSLGVGLFEGCEITEVTIPNSVTEIRTGAFKNCRNLNKVNFENGADTMVVYSSVFEGCISLTSITLPSGFQLYNTGSSSEIEPLKLNDLFVGCDNLESIKIDYAHSSYMDKDGVVYSKDQRTLIAYPVGRKGDYTVMGATTIDKGAFEGAIHLENITLGATVQYIKDYAFRQMPSLKTVSIPNSVLEINDYAFSKSPLLKTVTIDTANSRLRKIGKEAFYECRALESITLPNTVTYIGKQAFSLCSGLKTVKTSGANGNVEYDESRKEDCGICESAFSGCSALVNLEIPGSIAIIGTRAFGDLRSLKSVTISDSVVEIGKEAFAKDHNESVLSVVNMGKGVQTIGSNAFYGCDKLVSFTLPETLKTVASDAFSGCTGIKVVYNATGKDLQSGSGFGGILQADTVVIEGYPTQGNPQKPEGKDLVNKDDFLFWFDDNSVELIGYIGNDSNIKLPDTIFEQSYTIASGAFEDNTNIHSVTLGSGVTSIESNAFSNCLNLISITLNKGLKTIKDNAFSGCTALFEVRNLSDLTLQKDSSNGSVAANARYIYKSSDEESSLVVVNNNYVFDKQDDDYILIKYTGGSEAILPDDVQGEDYSIDKDAFKGASITNIIFGKGVKAIPDQLFNGTTSLKSVTVIGNGKTTIGNKAFYVFLRSTIESVTIGKGVKSIGEEAFSSWSGGMINELIIEDGVEEIGKNAFKKTTIFTELTIPASIKSIGESAFEGCDNLKELTILSRGDTVIEANAFKRSTVGNLTVVSLSEGIVSIGANAFASQDKLTDIIIPNSVTKIESGAFSGCTSLEFVQLGSGLTSLGTNVFDSCPLRSIVLTDGATMIPDNMLNGAKAIKNFVIPESVTTIGNNAFSGTSIISIDIPNSVTKIGNNAFASCTNLRTITLGEGLKEIGEKAFDGCTSLYEIYNLSKLNIRLAHNDYGGIALYAKVIHKNLNEESILISTDDGYTFIEIDGTWTLISYSGSEAAIVLPDIDHEYVIGDEVFRENYNLTSVIIPEGVTAIGDRAFWSDSNELGVSFSKLEHVQFPNSLKKIGKQAFYRCSRLSNVKLPKVEFIESEAFNMCTQLLSVDFGDSLVSIGSSAFSECAIEKLTFPASLKSLSSRAFYNLGALSGITFKGSIEASTIADETFNNCESLTWIVIEQNAILSGGIAGGNDDRGESLSGERIDIFCYGTQSDFEDSDITGFGGIYYYEETAPAAPEIYENKYWAYNTDGTPTRWTHGYISVWSYSNKTYDDNDNNDDKDILGKKYDYRYIANISLTPHAYSLTIEFKFVYQYVGNNSSISKKEIENMLATFTADYNKEKAAYEFSGSMLVPKFKLDEETNIYKFEFNMQSVSGEAKLNGNELIITIKDFKDIYDKPQGPMNFGN